MTRFPKHILLPIVLLITLTSIYVGSPNLTEIWVAVGFGVVGYLMRKIDMSPLPFVIAFILGSTLEKTARQAFDATGADPFFLFSSPTAFSLMLTTVVVIGFSARSKKKGRTL